MYTRAVSTRALHVDRRNNRDSVPILNWTDDRRCLPARSPRSVEVIDAVELIFDRLDDQTLHLRRRRTGISRIDHDDREMSHSD